MGSLPVDVQDTYHEKSLTDRCSLQQPAYVRIEASQHYSYGRPLG